MNAKDGEKATFTKSFKIQGKVPAAMEPRIVNGTK